jgi:hypothetical protein
VRTDIIIRDSLSAAPSPPPKAQVVTNSSTKQKKDSNSLKTPTTANSKGDAVKPLSSSTATDKDKKGRPKTGTAREPVVALGGASKLENNKRQQILGLVKKLKDEGTALEAKGLHNEAIVKYTKAMATQKRVCGDDHPDTIETRNAITWVNEKLLFVAQEKAEKQQLKKGFLMKKSAAEKLEDETKLMTKLTNDAVALEGKKRFDEAHEKLEELLTMQKSIFGDNHAETLKTMFSIMRIIEKMKGGGVTPEIVKPPVAAVAATSIPTTAVGQSAPSGADLAALMAILGVPSGDEKVVEEEVDVVDDEEEDGGAKNSKKKKKKKKGTGATSLN